MAYKKMTFDGEYSKWYNIIGSDNDNPSTLLNYTPILNNIQSLEIEGKYKKSVCNNIKSLDNSCNNIYKEINFNIQRVDKCVNSIYPNLESLKNKIDEYNSYIDEYYRIKAEIEKQKKSGGKNGNN